MATQPTGTPPVPRADGRPLRILYSFPHAFGSPGIGQTAWNQVRELVRAGHTVTLVAASVAQPVTGVREVEQTMVLGGRRVPHRAVGRMRAFGWHDRRAATRVHQESFDIVHAWPLASARTLDAAQDRGIPGLREVPNTHTAHAYEVVGREYARLGLPVPQGWSHHYDGDRLVLEDREYAAAHGLLVPSDAVAQSFLDRGFDNSRLLRHRYGFDPAVIRVPIRVDAARPFTAVFLGRCEPRKGLHFALDAWLASKASETGRFLIYGNFVPGYREMLAEQLAHPSVEVREFTDRPARVYAQADILLLPTIEEGSALVTYEAQGAGVIPLVSEASGAMVEHAVNGLLHTPGDVATLSSQIDLVFGSERWRRALKQGVLAHAPTLTWQAAGIVLVDLYRQALAQLRPEGYTARPGGLHPGTGEYPELRDGVARMSTSHGSVHRDSVEAPWSSRGSRLHGASG
ncbi:glycosyltransferase involved in cell wall biosynthesis [Okibacterium sp. HSC-33S16]|uniref:glycosyltransferase n=1 Tax=Okibacterium sp. HSC-33S16 TaxID=2910965 RepID=UPI0020A08C13|nr:glycosyltransferase [Okibacterium sp. HSC-33S16]MCP2032071.1 glycosyltransferase involved in cell wall biosynthesis [Okibacterium sp. HSC-33S16]